MSDEKVLEKILVASTANARSGRQELYKRIHQLQMTVEGLQKENKELLDELTRERKARDDCMDKIKGILGRANR